MLGTLSVHGQSKTATLAVQIDKTITEASVRRPQLEAQASVVIIAS